MKQLPYLLTGMAVFFAGINLDIRTFLFGLLVAACWFMIGRTVRGMILRREF